MTSSPSSTLPSTHPFILHCAASHTQRPLPSPLQTLSWSSPRLTHRLGCLGSWGLHQSESHGQEQHRGSREDHGSVKPSSRAHLLPHDANVLRGELAGLCTDGMRGKRGREPGWVYRGSVTAHATVKWAARSLWGPLEFTGSSESGLPRFPAGVWAQDSVSRREAGGSRSQHQPCVHQPGFVTSPRVWKIWIFLQLPGSWVIDQKGKIRKDKHQSWWLCWNNF